MHTDSGMTGISLSGYMPYMTVASLEMSDEPFFFASLLSGGAHFVQARGIISHAMPINISHAIPQQ